MSHFLADGRLKSYDIAKMQAVVEDDGATVRVDTSLLGPVEWHERSLIQLIGEISLEVT